MIPAPHAVDEPASLTAEQMLRRLGTTKAGLTADEAAGRRVASGANEVAQKAAERTWMKLLRQFTHMFAVVLWIAGGLCLIAAWQDPQGGMMALASAIVVVIAVNGIFSFVQEQRADRAVGALRKLLPLRSRALRDGNVVEIDARELVPGDVVLLEAGDQVPADCRLISSAGVRVNTSTLTGEPAAEIRDASAFGDGDALRSPNLLLAGTFLVSGRARAVVFATGMKTQFGRVAELAQAQTPVLSPLQAEIARLARLIAVLATALGAAFFALGHVLGLPVGDNLLFAVGTLVANVPEGLLPTVTLSLAMASQRMARRNALVRTLPAVETLGRASVICTDKTGTLTQNRMQIAALHCGGQLRDASEAPRLAKAYARLFEGAALCHDLVEINGFRRGDPMEIALVEMGERSLGAPPTAERLAGLPFDAERRRLTTLVRTDHGLLLHTKGAFEAVVPLCSRQLTEGGATDLSDEACAALLHQAEVLADRGWRVIAFAFGEPTEAADPASLERNLVFAGLVAFEDPPRPEVPAALEQCRAASIRVIMVTGDHPRTALAVARQIGLVRGEPRMLTGDTVRTLSKEELDAAMRATEVIVARADPADKRLIVEALKRNGEIVAVTGDGANDAPALRDADIGIAMGRSGTDVARDAADLVLLDDNFASIVAAVEEGRTVFANIRKFMTYILTSNVPEMVPYLAFVLLRTPLALTILQILAVDLGTDMLPALALGAEPPGPGTMLHPPRKRGERLFDGGLLLRAYLWLGAMEAVAAMAAFFAALHRGGWTWGTALLQTDPLYIEATTACLATVVVMQVANVLLCRSETQPLVNRGLRQNPMLMVGIAAELALIAAVVYTPIGRAIFGTAAIPLVDWVYAVPFAAGMIVLEESRKAVSRHSSKSLIVTST